jgi:hypothetical protein
METWNLTEAGSLLFFQRRAFHINGTPGAIFLVVSG